MRSLRLSCLVALVIQLGEIQFPFPELAYRTGKNWSVFRTHNKRRFLLR
jgi:hypothetical protein